ncbi:hypothetical protein ACWDCL_01910 [Streptomyces sp. NPDC001009]
MPSKIQDEAEVRRWFEEGLTYTEMQAIYREKYNIETSVPMWSAWRRRNGIERRNLRDAELIPWRVKEEHRHKYPAIMLRAEARSRAERKVSDRDMGRLKAWKQWLGEENLVVHYDADTSDGFFYVPREETDADLVRRPPEGQTGNKARD